MAEAKTHNKFRKPIRTIVDQSPMVTYSAPVSSVPSYMEFTFKEGGSAIGHFVRKQIERVHTRLKPGEESNPVIPYYSVHDIPEPQFNPEKFNLKIKTPSLSECHPIQAVEFAFDNGIQEMANLRRAFQNAMQTYQPPSSSVSSSASSSSMTLSPLVSTASVRPPPKISSRLDIC